MVALLTHLDDGNLASAREINENGEVIDLLRCYFSVGFMSLRQKEAALTDGQQYALCLPTRSVNEGTVI